MPPATRLISVQSTSNAFTLIQAPASLFLVGVTLPATRRSSPSSAVRGFGCHPAATPAATIPAMTVGAPNAEFDLDRNDLVRGRSGVFIGLPTVSSWVGVCGVLTIELDLECDGLLDDRCIIVSLGCWIANFKLFKRPPFIRLRKLSSSGTSAKGSGYMSISSSEIVSPGTLDTRCFRKLGIRASSAESGIRRMIIPTGIERNPKNMAIPHIVADCPPSAIWKAAPPTKMINTWPPHIMALMPMKNGFLKRPSKILNLLSRRRLLGGIVSCLLLQNSQLQGKNVERTYFH